MHSLRLCSALISLLWAINASADTIVFVVPESANAMPMARIENSEIKAGIHLDLARAVSAELEMDYEIVVTARARIDLYFTNQLADVWCYARPEWTSLPLNFSQPILRNSEAVVWHKDAKALTSLSELANQPIGTIGGFFYPVLNRLGDDFVRDDSPNFETNVLKLTSQRVQYLYADELLFNFYQRVYPSFLPVSERRLRVNEFDLQCALHPDGRVSVADFNGALNRLWRSGRWPAILENYGVAEHLPTFYTD